MVSQLAPCWQGLGQQASVSIPIKHCLNLIIYHVHSAFIDLKLSFSSTVYFSKRSLPENV